MKARDVNHDYKGDKIDEIHHFGDIPAIGAKKAPIRKIIAVIFLSLVFIDCFQLCWTGWFGIYLPNKIRKSGYKTLNKFIKNIDKQIESTNEFIADIRYFWRIMPSDEDDSICSEALARFRPLAQAYSDIDYYHYIQPLIEYRDYIEKYRDELYPNGAKKGNPLPRVWKQRLIKKQIILSKKWLAKSLDNEEYSKMRKIMVDVWTNISRGLDGSKTCVYMRLAWRQMAQDIIEEAIDQNIRGMEYMIEKLTRNEAKLLKHAKKSDASAQKKIEAEQTRVEKLKKSQEKTSDL